MLNLGPIINQGNPGQRGGLWSWKSRRGEGSRVQEIREEGGSKTLPIHQGGGGVDFFWNSPLSLTVKENETRPSNTSVKEFEWL